MAILDFITIGSKKIYNVDANPSTGLAAPIGALALWDNAGFGKLFLKRSSLDTGWICLDDINVSSNVKMVGMTGSQFTSINAAIADCSAPSDTNRYVILVDAGVYTEAEITVPSYISIIGTSEGSVIIQPSGNHNVVTLTNPHVELCFLRIRNAPIGFRGVQATGCGDYVTFTSVHIENCDYGIDIHSTTTEAIVKMEICDIENCSNPAYIHSDGTVNASLQTVATNIINKTAAVTTNAVTVIGIKSRVELHGGGIKNSVAPGTKVGILAHSGAYVEMADIVISDWASGCIIQNTGTAPNLDFRGPEFEGCTIDLNIAHTGTTGIANYYGAKSKTIIASNSISLVLTDREVPGVANLGAMYLGDTYANLQDYKPIMIQQPSPGVLSGGALTHVGLGITCQAGYGYLSTGTAPNEVLKYVNFTSQTITVAANSLLFIYINSNGTLQSAGSQPNHLQNLILGEVVTDATSVYVHKRTERHTQYVSAKLEEMLRNAIGVLYFSGSFVTENTLNPRQINVSSGEYYFGSSEFKPTGGQNRLLQPFYRNGLGGWTVATPIYPIATSSTTWLMDNGTGTLATVTLNKYVNYYIYVVNDGADENYLMVYGQNEFVNLVDARNEVTPALPPLFYTNNIAAIARITARQGDINFTEVKDIRPLFGTQSSGNVVVGTTDHLTLSNLTTGNSGHTQFLMLDGSTTMTGSLKTTAATNQLELGSGINKVTINGGTSAAARTYLIPNSGVSDTFAMLAASQTFSGNNIFSNNVSLSAMTAGSVPFIGASGLISQDNANLFWNNTLKALGIGTNSPAYDLHNFKSAAAASASIVNQSTSTSGSTGYIGQVDTGFVTLESYGSLHAIAYLRNRGIVTATAGMTSGLSIMTTGAANPISFHTNYLGGATPNERMRIDGATGYVGIATTSPTYLLDIKTASTASQLHISGLNADSGMYLTSTVADNAFVGAGVAFNGAGWIAKSAAASIIAQGSGDIQFLSNVGLTVGAGFTPTVRMTVRSDGNVKIGSGPAASLLEIGGSLALPIVSKTANYTATISDHTILCNGTFTVTLPTAVGITGRTYVIKNIGLGLITVAANGTEKIDGVNSVGISIQYDGIHIQTDGANWFII